MRVKVVVTNELDDEADSFAADFIFPKRKEEFCSPARGATSPTVRCLLEDQVQRFGIDSDSWGSSRKCGDSR